MHEWCMASNDGECTGIYVVAKLSIATGHAMHIYNCLRQLRL